ncbi:MAG: hypothetical protein OER90_01710 [Gemmatimonadota bacterium]|nr:hypothetical protein [Gemmatimonadota bacterium]
MNGKTEHVFAAPVFLLISVLLFSLAIIEKGLNMLGTGVPFLAVNPRLLLEYGVFLLILDIALLLRQNLESKL